MFVQTTPDADALTTDGGIVHIRAVTPQDRGQLMELYRHASPESLRMRFFVAPGDHTIAAEVDRLCRPPVPAEYGAVLGEIAGQVVGVASYERAETRSGAEFAVFVADDHRHRGVGTLLLEHLSAAARAAGLTELTGDVLPANATMLRVAADLTGHTRSRFADGVLAVGLPTGITDDALGAADTRDRAAQRAALRPLLAPRSVAVVGAGRTPGGIGHETLRSLLRYGFTGAVYAVNPHATRVYGVPAYPTLSALPEPVDLAVFAVPAPAVVDAMRDAATAGVRAVVILTSGLGEGGAAGRDAQRELVDIARTHGIRVVGPNCIGLLNTDPAVRIAATFAPVLAPHGGLAVASQSGAVGIAMLEHATRSGCGVSTFVSLGNKADVSGNDLIAYWHDDPATRAVALYLESFGNPRRFARLVRRLARSKPVLAVKAGRSSAGARAGASHTAAAAAPDTAVDTLFAQAGVIRVETLGELIDTARLVTDQPLPEGNRLGIVGNAGGVNVLAADAADAAGLRVASLSEAVRTRLNMVLPPMAGDDNPLDLGAGASPTAFADAVRTVADSGEVDALVLVVAATRANNVPAVLNAVAPVLEAHPRITVAAVVLGMPHPPATMGNQHVPVYDLPERAVRAIGHAAWYANWLREPAGTALSCPVDATVGRLAVDTALATAPGWQPYEPTAKILRSYGIPLVPTVTASTGPEAVAAANEIGYPVVLKAGDPHLVHKSDVGGVQLNLTTAGQVRAAYRKVARGTGTARPTVLVQPMARGQVELVAGVVHDRLFGSLVMVGLGGVHTDLLADRALRLTPMTDLDAGRMWRSLRAAPLLTGYRGAPPVDTAAVEDLLSRLGRLAEDLPEVAELDLNPVLAGPDGLVVVDAKLRLAPVGAEPDGTLRQLRAPG
ncbi:GNAT family N-acetyltransferase [Plantactinospora sp. KLBMP9567]|uniref:bifunctional acetate--CoA ligase family protein/GNAT family N-acetyltransferase n=1 Tax=Plantactinospora sp. KLBMP9567 TaxID=3085900 RepID=UPI0029820474|nr:GNAT family N-acetyltransferase [Plantactinospora sp. KLBMP9567]MDW5330411.1 GNAT family N-acetyltransferase [Plantactinospora sp. KLBMP9567]